MGKKRSIVFGLGTTPAHNWGQLIGGTVRAAQPYLRLSRADVLRMLLDKGLSATSCRAQEKPLAD